jgi:hypothetical protein
VEPTTTSVHLRTEGSTAVSEVERGPAQGNAPGEGARVIAALRRRADEMQREAQQLFDDAGADSHRVLFRMPVLAVMADEFRALADECEKQG